MRSKTLPFLFALALVAVIFVFAEIILRVVLDYQPWSYTDKHRDEPTIHEYDPLLGWDNKTGTYLFAPYSAEGKEITITIRDSNRITSYDKVPGDPQQIVFIGGSYTQGFAISDNETFVWKLQERHPSIDLLNFAVGGFGTYQSLLKLKREVPVRYNPKTVIYNFMGDHEIRNVANDQWMDVLSRYSHRGHIDIPYATLDSNGHLVEHPPQGYPATPFRESSVIITLAERAYMRQLAKKRTSQRREITEKILVELKEYCDKLGIEFIVNILEAGEETKRHYLDFLDKQGILALDCALPITRGMRVAGEGHPNGRMNSRWARCIDDYMVKNNLISE